MKFSFNKLLILFGCSLFFFLSFQYCSFLHDRVILLSSHLIKDSSFFSKLSPSNLIEVGGEGYAKIFPGTSIFSLRTSFAFDNARIRLFFQPQNAEVIRFGAQKIAYGPKYDFKVIYNRVLEESSFDRISEVRDGRNIVLFQKKRLFTTIDEFLENIPKDASIYLYHYDLPEENTIPKKMEEQNGGFFIPFTLRGPHRFVFYKDENEPLTFSFDKEDLNFYEGADEFRVRVFDHERKIISDDLVKDDGISGVKVDDAIPPQHYEMRKDGLLPGVYMIEISSIADDYYLYNIRSSLLLGEIVDKVALALHENEKAPNQFSLFTDAEKMYIQRQNEQACSEVSMQDERFSLDEVRKSYPLKIPSESLESENTFTEIRCDQGGIVLTSKDSYFTPRKENYFYPYAANIKKFKDYEYELPSDADFILSEYYPSIQEDDVYQGELSVNFDNVYFDQGGLSFGINVVGDEMQENAGKENSVIIQRVELDGIQKRFFQGGMNDLKRTLKANLTKNVLTDWMYEKYSHYRAN